MKEKAIKQEKGMERGFEQDVPVDLATSLDIGQKAAKTWFERYAVDPRAFFVKEVLEGLDEVSQAERLAMLGAACDSLHVTLEDIKKYYGRFPEDFRVVESDCRNQEGRPVDRRAWAIWTASQPLMPDCRAEWTENEYFRYPIGDYEQLEAIALRRQYAPGALMSGLSDMEAEDFSRYGQAAEGFLAVLEESRIPSAFTTKFLNPKKAFTREFQRLSQEEKSRFLRQAITRLHDDIIWEEVYNSGFLPITEGKEGEFGSTSLHSSLFKTKHANSFYRNEGIFLYSMDNSADRGGALEEAAKQRFLLALIGEIAGQGGEEKEANIDHLLDFWDKNRNPLFAGALARAFSQLDPNLAAEKIMQKIKQEKGDKNYLSAMLYRLEFGRLNISKEGVTYLQRMYDLGEYNNPEYYAQRLTIDGEVGIFDDDFELIKYFELGDLIDDKKKVKARVLDFTYETLFLPKPDETSEERAEREIYLEEFRKNYYVLAQDRAFEQSGVQLNNLSFREQGWFLTAFNRYDEEEKEELRTFVANNREEGIKSFLALEVDFGLGKDILSIARSLSESRAGALFLKLSQLASLAASETEALRAYSLEKGDPGNIDWGDIRVSLLNRLAGVIREFSSQAKEGYDVENFSRELSRIKPEILFLASLLKSVKENEYDLDWSLIKDFELSMKPLEEDLPDGDKREILSMAEENWHSFGNPKMAEAVVEGLKASLDKASEQICYVLKYKGEVAAFVRFELTDHGTLYAGSLNVSQKLHGLNIGNEMMEQAIKREAASSVLEATASIKIPAGCAYVEKLGFVADGLIEDYHGSGESLFSIRLDEEKNLGYRLRSEGKEIGLGIDSLRELAIPCEKAGEHLGEPIIVLRCDLSHDFFLYEQVLRSLLPSKNENGQLIEAEGKEKLDYLLTRYFPGKDEDGDIRYLAFERE